MKRYISLLILMLSIVVIFFLPFGVHIDLGSGTNTIISMIWEIPLEPSWYTIRFFSAIQYYLTYCVFRFVFLLEIILLLFNKSNRLRFILMGVISELIPLVLSIPAMYILNAQGDNLLPIIFPIPILLMFDLFIAFTCFRRKNINNIDHQKV